MNFETLEAMCSRAVAHTFNWTKFAVTTAALLVCSVILVFFKSLCLSASLWVTLCLSYLPFFISCGILMALGVIVIRAYHDEIKGRSYSYAALIASSWETLLTAAFSFFPVILVYIVLWLVLGIFLALREIPLIGDFFSTFFVIGPFFLLCASSLLVIGSFFFVFSAAPLLSLRSVSKEQFLPHVVRLFRECLFQRICFLILALLPCIAIGLLVWFCISLTTALYFVQESHMQLVLQWAFLMLPVAAFFAFPVIFFFHMSAEAHISIQKKSI